MTGDDALRERVAELEARLERVTRAQAEHERTATDSQGRKWTVSDLMGMGLTRRQALGAVAAIVGGATLSSALSGQVAAQPTGDEGAVGQSGDRVEVWASEIDATEVATDERSVTNIVGAASHNTTQNLTTSAITQVTLDVNDIEDSSVVDVDLANNKLITKKSGKYFCVGQVTFAGSTGWSLGDFVRAQLVAGGTGRENQAHHTGANALFSVTATAIFDLAQNDDILLRAEQRAGQNEEITGTTSTNYLQVAFLG